MSGNIQDELFVCGGGLALGQLDVQISEEMDEAGCTCNLELGLARPLDRGFQF